MTRWYLAAPQSAKFYTTGMQKPEMVLKVDVRNHR